MRVILLLALSVGMASAMTAQQKEVLNVPGAVAGLPFSPAIRVGNIIYLSGQLGNRMGTRELVPGGIEAETRQTLENIKTVV
ncbi:MAG TPA: Rid family hydrolase, partial [Gemmatimonadales bacterium]|nr:Rid family hydrolase [Gemmatimonadales bacterium]